MVDNDDNIRIQLENGYNHWEFEGGMEQTFIFHHDWFDISKRLVCALPLPQQYSERALLAW